MFSVQSRVEGTGFGRGFVAAGKIFATAAESQESPGYGESTETTAPKIRVWGDLLALAAVCQLG